MRTRKNLIRILLVSYSLFAFFNALSAQDQGKKQEQVVVGLTPFEFSNRTADPTYVSMIYDRVAFVLSRNPAVKLVDRGSWDRIQEEREVLKTEPFILSETIEQGKSAGAQKIVSGKVYLTDIRPEGNGYAVSFSLYLAVIDLESGVVEDNIMLSPNGLEDTDKLIEITKKIRPLLSIPGIRLANKMLRILELFDVAATYQVAGLSQNDSFEEALLLLDKDIIPFFGYHFEGDSTAYEPSGSRLARVTDSYDDIDSGPVVEPEIKFEIVEKLNDEQIQILGEDLHGIKTNSRFALISESEIIDVTLQGDSIRNDYREELAQFTFESYAGDFTNLSIDEKKSKNTIDEILENRDKEAKLFVINLKPASSDDPPEEQPRFQIYKRENDNQLQIVASSSDGIKKNSKFHLIKESPKTYTDWNGEKGKGAAWEVLAEFSFVEDRGDFQVIELEDKKSELTMDQILSMIKNLEKGKRMFVTFKLKGY